MPPCLENGVSNVSGNKQNTHLTKGVVPRNYLRYYADGLAQGVGEFLVGGADGLAEDFVGPAGVVAEGGDGFGQVFGEGYGVGFALRGRWC